MPRAWSAKDERQYEHVKSSERKRGRSTKRAKEIAARTVNKQRRKEGRVESTTNHATGNPKSRLEERSLSELKNRGRELHIRGRSSMNKSDLIRAIRKKG